MAKVAFLGLGVMGYPMAGHLRTNGHDVTVYNRTAARAEKWVEEFGGRRALAPSEAAKGQEFVFACVGNDDDLRAVTTGAEGAFESLEKSAVFVDHTTASAVVARELNAIAKAQGSGFVDAPISGGQAGAEAGALSVMCGGAPDDYTRAERVIFSYAKACRLMGPPGAGQLTRSALPGSFRLWPKAFISPSARDSIPVPPSKSSARARRNPGRWTTGAKP
jgi:3-hydroxyisobutyrate dehydrogenase